MALATIFQNTNQNTLGLLVYQNSSKYFRFAIKRPPYFAFLTSKNGKGASRLFTGVSRRSVNQSRVMGRSVTLVADRPKGTHASRGKGEHAACSIPAAALHQSTTALPESAPWCLLPRNQWQQPTAVRHSDLHSEVYSNMRSKFDQNTLGLESK